MVVFFAIECYNLMHEREDIMELVFTLLVGLFMVIGTILVFFTNQNKNFVNFSISMAFGVMVALGLLELLPESYEIVSEYVKAPYAAFVVIIGIIIGIQLLKILDHFVPDHGHDHVRDKEHKHNLFHIGVISSVALVLHNLLEGITLYNTLETSLKVGLLMCLGIGLHNIPIGMVIASTFYNKTKSKKKTLLISIVIALSTFVGGILAILLKGITTNEFLEGVLLSVTLGMIIHITMFELLKQIREIENKKIRYGGVLVGILLLVISILF